MDGESLRVLNPVAPNQAGAIASLHCRYTVPVHLLLIDPTGPVEWGGDLGSVH